MKANPLPQPACTEAKRQLLNYRRNQSRVIPERCACAPRADI